MEYPNFDGECHAVPGSKEFGYIAARVDAVADTHENLKHLQTKVEEQLKKYSEYLVNQYKEKAIDILTDVFRAQVRCGCTPEDYQLIHRPPWVVSAIAQYGTLVLKFKRSEKDILDDGSKSCSRCC